MELSPYLKTYPCPDQPGRLLLLATRRCAVLELSEEKWAAVRDNGNLEEEERATLLRLGVLTPDRAAERREMRGIFDRVNRESRHLAVLVTLTLECNLACPYCFEDPFRGRFRMDETTADLLVQRMTGRMAAGLDLTMDFYGGEPLLALPLLKSIAGRLQRAAREQGVTFGFNIFTNGVLLTPPIVEELLPLGLAAARVTLDGPAKIHDSQRPFVSGKGSFETVVANIRSVYKRLPIDLGGNYTRDNYRRFPELLDELIGRGMDPAGFKAVVFTPVIPRADGSTSVDISSTCTRSDEPWMIEAGIFLRKEVLRRGFPAPKLRTSACMVEFENDLVVSYDGGLYKCPVFMGREELRIGTLADGPGDYRESHNLELWQNDECLECAYLPLCYGGCRFLRLLKTGAIDGVDCRKNLFDASLERIIRQDLEYGGNGHTG